MSSDGSDRDDQGMPPPPPPPPGSGGGAPPPPESGWGSPSPGYGGQPPADPGSPSGGWGQPAPGQEWGLDRPAGPQPAGIGLRIGAYIIDVILVGIVNAILGLVFRLFMSGPGITAPTPFMTVGDNFLVSFLVGLVGAVITLAYFGLLEANDGQTLGKKLVGIRAVKADGSKLELADGVKRRLPFVIGSLIPIPFLGGLVGFGFALAILITTASDNPWNRGLHDKWADTMVVRA